MNVCVRACACVLQTSVCYFMCSGPKGLSGHRCKSHFCIVSLLFLELSVLSHSALHSSCFHPLPSILHIFLLFLMCVIDILSTFVFPLPPPINSFLCFHHYLLNYSWLHFTCFSSNSSNGPIFPPSLLFFISPPSTLFSCSEALYKCVYLAECFIALSGGLEN